MFQSTVNRNFTQGFPGEIAKDGPLRTRVARIASVNDPNGFNTNHISRVFTFSADIGAVGQTNPQWPNGIAAPGGAITTNPATEISVTVGGTGAYAGILIHPKHYALYGTSSGGPLAASYDLPQYTEAEFATMAILFAEIWNDTTSTKAVNFGDLLFYVNNASGETSGMPDIPLGGLVSYATVSAANASAYGTAGLLTQVPGGVVTNSMSLAAGVAQAVSSFGTTIISVSQ